MTCIHCYLQEDVKLLVIVYNEVEVKVEVVHKDFLNRKSTVHILSLNILNYEKMIYWVFLFLFRQTILIYIRLNCFV